MIGHKPAAAGRRGVRRRARGWRAAIALVAMTALAATTAACGGAPSSFDAPPASLDPSSPKLVARDLAFDTTELRVPANTPFTLIFDNRDAASHNVSFLTYGENLHRVFDSTPFGGPRTRWYPVPALTPGRYKFVCDLHSNMFGEVVAS